MRIIQNNTFVKGLFQTTLSLAISGLTDEVTGEVIQSEEEEAAMLDAFQYEIDFSTLKYSSYVKLNEEGIPEITTEEAGDGELITVPYNIFDNIVLNKYFSVTASIYPYHDMIKPDEMFNTPELMTQAYLTVFGHVVAETIENTLNYMRENYTSFIGTIVYENK